MGSTLFQAPTDQTSRALTLEVLRTINQAKNEHLARYAPFEAQLRFHKAGKKYRERTLLAGNQLGKTWAASREVAYHLTGLYPDWWEGRVWNRPTSWWASSITSELTRDNPQNRLFGETQADWGTGAIPRSCIDFSSITMSKAVGGLIDKVRIQHVSGGWSQLSLKFYLAGVAKWQGKTLDGVWFDEEPPMEIYSEGLTRTNLGTAGMREDESGISIISATPLLGMTDVVEKFYPEPKTATCHLTQMEIWDLVGVLYTQEQAEAIVAAYPAHERDARARGIPLMGTGRVFPILESMVTEPEVDPDRMKRWKKIGGLDIGWDHPTAFVNCALEPIPEGKNVFHVYSAYKQAEQPIAVHASAIKARGAWIPVAWPHDALQTDKASSLTWATHYIEEGVNMLPEHAQYEDGGNAIEPGVADMLSAMLQGRFKVAEHLIPWLNEFRLYHRAVPRGATTNRTPKIVAILDDLMSATRYAWMMQRFAEVRNPPRFIFGETAGMDWDPFGGPGGGEIKMPGLTPSYNKEWN